MTDSNAELREVKLKGVYPGNKVEITFDVKPAEKPCKKPEPEKPKPDKSKPDKPDPPKHTWTQVTILIVLLFSLVAVVNCYVYLRVKIKIDGPYFRTPKPYPSKPYCPKPKPYPDPCHR
jgi:hypothetical protein